VFKRCQKFSGKPNFARIKLVDDSYFILNKLMVSSLRFQIFRFLHFCLHISLKKYGRSCARVLCLTAVKNFPMAIHHAAITDELLNTIHLVSSEFSHWPLNRFLSNQ